MKRYVNDWDAYVDKNLERHMLWEQDCAHIDLRIDELTERYQSLDLVKDDIPILRNIRKPICRRFLVFKGKILRECSSLKYDHGTDRCKELSSEVRYASKHHRQMHAQRVELQSALEKMVKVGEGMKTYPHNLASEQINELSRVLSSGDEILNNSMIYFRPLKDKYGSLIDSNRERANSLLADQADYIRNIISEVSSSLWGPITGFKEAQNAIDAITKGSLILEPYLNSRDALQILRIDIDHAKNTVNTGNAIKSRLLGSVQVYETLQRDMRELGNLASEIKKYGLSEPKLNTLASLVNNSKTEISLPYTALQQSYDAEHSAHLRQINVFVDDIIDMVDRLASRTPVDSGDAKEIMKFYEKIKTFRDIHERIRGYDEKIRNSLDEEIKSGKRQSYRIVSSKPKIETPIVHSSIFDRINMIELPDDTRYWRIGDILLGKRLIDGWLDRLVAVESEINKLSCQKDLARTDYILSIADAVKDSYTDGYLHELASMDPESKTIVESSLNALYSFGRSVAM